MMLPKDAPMEKWAVIACDQFTSDYDYWQRVRANAEGCPSTINLVLPEAILGTPEEETQTALINKTMGEYIDGGVFTTYANSFVYVERTMENGTIRKGLVGMVDLEAYDFTQGATTDIRATERTVIERIPPRVKVRKDAPVELPHIIMLVDDHDKVLIEPITARKDSLKKVYECDLMEDGGHIAGWIVEGADVEAFNAVFEEYSANVGSKYADLEGVPMILATGDGNHSLATAKTCYEELKAANPGVDLSNHPARYALVEVENIHDEAQVFEPIHRIIMGLDPEKVLADARDAICVEDSDAGFEAKVYIGEKEETIYLDKGKGELAVGVLQEWLDAYLKANGGDIDYIHDDDALIALAAKPMSIGFLLPAMEKSQLFRGVIADGSLPRKTFSMGHSREKRYYVEARKIK
ncbi:MAG: DUF1015 domain-containing protein [Clostridiales bacterium]|nr:DUF1015 domain-containing protein [Clostridiales bacterium]